MADVIRVDYQALQQVAAKFSKEAEAVEAMLTALNSAMNPLENGWIGQGSDAFFNEMSREILPAVRRLAHALHEAGRTTNHIVEFMQQADEEASSGFQSSGEDSGQGGFAGQAGSGGLFGGGLGASSAGQTSLGGFLNSIGFGGSSFGSSGSLGASFFGSDMFGGTLGSGLYSGDPFGNGLFGNSSDFGIPRDWLSGVRDSLNDFTNNNFNNYGIPNDWLGNVLDESIPGGESGSSDSGGEAGGASGGGASGGGSSGGGSSGAGGGETPANMEPKEAQPASSSGGGSGGSSAPSTEINSPYGSAPIPREFRGVSVSAVPVEAAQQAGGLLYQSLGPMGGSPPAVSSPTAAPPATSAAAPTTAAPEAGGKQSHLGVTLGLAAISPFAALLGKAISGNDED